MHRILTPGKEKKPFELALSPTGKGEVHGILSGHDSFKHRVKKQCTPGGAQPCFLPGRHG